MERVVLLVAGLCALASAHYEGYPFEHRNEGRYGAEHPYANYGPADQPIEQTEQAPEPYLAAPAAYPLTYNNYQNFGEYPYAGYRAYYPNGYYGQYYGGYYGSNLGDYAYTRDDSHNHEFDYRSYAGNPVQQGYGQFQFLGTYGGACDATLDHGLYIADEENSFVVCAHGRSHRFQCPKGTKNRAFGDLQHDHKYGIEELCGVNTLPTK